MISSYIVDKVKYTTEIMEYMDNNITLKYKDLIKGVEKDLAFNQRNVERYMKTSIGISPMFYYERRKLTITINEIINNTKNIKTICKKYNYRDKKELNRKCKVYFNAEIDEIIRNKSLYILQDKIKEADMLYSHKIGADVVQSLKLTKMAQVKRKENVYKIKLTLDRMPVYVLPELTYNSIRDEFIAEKFDLRGFLLRVAMVDKSIKEKTNIIKFNRSHSEIINYCFQIYNLMKPININGICYIGVDQKITYRYLEKNGISNRFGINKSDIAKQIKVRYLGNSIAIPLDSNDNLSFYFFTEDLESNLDVCTVDFSIDLKESEIKKIINRVYAEYKDIPPDLNGIDKDLLSDDTIKALDNKTNTFRHGETITVSIINNKIVAINDFYPKAKLITDKEVLSLIKILINKIKNTYNKDIKVEDNIMASGYEIVNKIIRFSKDQPNNSIGDYMRNHFNRFDELEDLFVDLSAVYIEYINDKITEKQLISDSKQLFNEIYKYIDILKKIYKIILYQI